MSWARGDGGLCADAIDLARWAHALGSGEVLAETSLAAMTSRRPALDGVTPDYGFALSLIELDGEQRRFAHDGAIGGYSGTLAYYPDEQLAIAVLTNLAGTATGAIEKRLARALLGMPEPSWSAAPLPLAERRRVLGRYDMGAFEIQVLERDGRLRLEMPPPGPSDTLIAVGGGELACEADPDVCRLLFASEGPRAERVRFLMANMHWYGRRIEPPPAPPGASPARASPAQALPARKSQRRPE
jgi:hypothetical protein